MHASMPTTAELEAALKHLHNPEALRSSPLATLNTVHQRVGLDQRVADRTQIPLPWIYGYELAALLRERIDRLQVDAGDPDHPEARRSSTRTQLYAHILRLRYVDHRTWNEVAAIVGLASGHIQNKLKRPALQRLLGDLLDQRDMAGPAVPGVLEATRGSSAYLTNLPAPSEFIGRRAEVEGVLTKLRRRRMPIIEISGVGGVGKSALAKHIGWRALEEHLVDAAVWLSAKDRYLPIAGARPADFRQGLRSLDDLFETTARVLGASQVPIEPEERRRQALAMLTAERFPRGVLIIVDNYETLRPDEQERIVTFLFEELPYPSQALITSRHEEHLVVVQSHVLPIKIQLERMSRDDAAACLEYFLSLQSPLLVTSAAVKEQITEISARIPLAMLWLLGQLRYTPRGQLETLAEIKRARGETGALLSYIFDHSYALLRDQPDAQASLHALTAFVEPVPFEPLAASAGLTRQAIQQALRLLQQLSLITREGAEEPRYGLLELARGYLASRIAATERQELMRRAAAYYATHQSQPDRANVLALLEWAIEHRQLSLSIDLFDAVAAEQFLESDTQARDCATYGADIVRAARTLGDERRADWYEIFAICWPMVVRHESLAARLALERLLERAVRHDWQDNRALACSTLGLLFNDLGVAATNSGHDATALYENAAAYLRQAAALWEDLGRRDWLAVVMGRLGTVARELGDYGRALDYYTWTAALYDSLGHQAGRASVLGRRGYTLLQRYRAHGQGDPEEISRLLLEALQLNEQVGNRWGIAANCLRYAEFLELQGAPARAQIYAERAQALFASIPEPRRARHAEELLRRLRGPIDMPPF